MGTAIKASLGLGVFGLIGLIIYGYSVDMAPTPQPQSLNVVLNAK